jgi:integrase
MTRGGWGDGTLTEVSAGKWKLRLPPYLGRGQVTFRAVNKTAAKKQQRRILDDAYREMFDPEPAQAPTFDELCDHTLGRYRDTGTISKMTRGLKTARDAFGDVRVDALSYDTIHEWERTERARVAEATVCTRIQAVKTVLNDAVRRGVIAESPARHVKNPAPRPSLITPFETLAEVEAVAAEMPPEWQALPMFACGSGLRIEEWLALERGDVRGGVIYVNKRWVDGMLKPGTKNGDPERLVPLTALAAQALRSHPTRLDTKLLFPRADGGYLNYDRWKRTVWKNAFKAAGVPFRRPKDTRHSFATWQLLGNCNTWTLAKTMGTGVKNLERTYGRWIPGSEQVVLAAMDAFVERQSAAK